MTDSLNDVPDVPIVFVSNAYLDDLTANMRSRPIPWEGYHRAGIITQEELDLIKAVDKQSKEQVNDVMERDGDKYAVLYTNLLEKSVRIDTVQYVLVLVGDMLADNEGRVIHFHDLSKQDPELPYRVFLKRLDTDDEFVQLAAAKILTLLVCSTTKPSSSNVDEFFQWIYTRLKSSDPNIYDLAVQMLESILRVPDYRFQFWESLDSVDALVYLLKSKNPTPQMQYQIIFCFWLLTFEKKIASEFNTNYDLIPKLVDIAKSAIKEKIIRVIIGTFRNLVEKAPEANLPAMLVAKLLNFCENLSSRKWSDSEIQEDIAYLKVELQNNFQSLTTFDEYASELRSGKLQWSPAHESEQFWRQNAHRLNENDYELLRILVHQLVTSSDTLVLAVSAHDLGQYVKYCPKGKKFLQEVGAKQRVMAMMTHEDPEVRYQALIAVQKYMTNAW
ncbi:3055_t:CDS:10 [Paraglomus brasilianum]|uniref:V-type proton ATPase subunit H n=1 Tax=Paraglomus brasilianum TaxID=144538 RepID=A0A9N9D7H6_9GLOM|nr:3055_t:CDS:10 [Paraglomus brasilianum]